MSDASFAEYLQHDVVGRAIRKAGCITKTQEGGNHSNALGLKEFGERIVAVGRNWRS